MEFVGFGLGFGVGTFVGIVLGLVVVLFTVKRKLDRLQEEAAAWAKEKAIILARKGFETIRFE